MTLDPSGAPGAAKRLISDLTEELVSPNVVR